MSKKLVKKADEEVTNKDLLVAIDNLAVSTAKGFEQVDKRFEQVDKRFEQVDRRFDEVDRRFEGVDTRLNNLTVATRENTRGINLINVRLGLRDSEMDELQVKVTNIDKRVKRLEKTR